MKTTKLIAAALAAAPVYAGTPHPKMFQFLKDQAMDALSNPANNAGDNADGKIFWNLQIGDTRFTWILITKWDDEPVQAARLLITRTCPITSMKSDSSSSVTWNLATGMMQDETPGAVFDMDTMGDKDRYGYPSWRGLNPIPQC
jgi:hypothetical protein